MKILLVSDQGLIIKNDKVYGTVNFTNTLKRLSHFGELYVCLQDASKFHDRILMYNDDVTQYIPVNNIVFVNKSYLWPSHKTIKLIKNQIEKVDMVFGYVPAINAEVAMGIAHKTGKPYLAFLVGCIWDGLWNQDWKRKIAAPYRFLLTKHTMKHTDYAMYVTNQFLQNRYPSPAKKNLGLSDVVLEKIDDYILEKRLLKINERKEGDLIKIATVAMLNQKFKGQRFVIRAIRKLKDMGYKNYKYYLIGGGDDSALRKLTHELELTDEIVFVGKVSHEKVFELLDDIDIYIQPSLQEGLPRSVVEAMSRGLPCIGAATGAIPELLDPRRIAKRKSVDDLVSAILTLSSKDEMAKDAERNFQEAKKYECERLDKLRNNFYKEIADEISGHL